MSDFLLQSPETDRAVARPCVVVAVVMRRERIDNRWQPWRWVLADVVWVVWRMEEAAALAEEPVAVPHIVTLSYHDAGRWLDAQETVEQVPASLEVAQWLQAFVDQHHVLEAKRRQRPQSFKTLQDRFGNPVRVSTDKAGGSGRG
ncbi:MAG: hypothetical protein B7Y42_11530 [Polaromonas sp. 28-63-22]|nr:MAG: hypothetical protein B7Y42_11530 [Polaromonas sp. 28-63-22]